jgi:hypothetical protein
VNSPLAVIVPSRGRPNNIVDLLGAWRATDTAADLFVAVDDDDPTLVAYKAIHATDQEHGREWALITGPRLRMGPTLNVVAYSLRDDYRHLGFMGDDHRPRTPGWDVRFSEALDTLGTGLVYGNDLIHGKNLPTAVAMTSDIVAALGGMVPKGMIHLYLDNFWLQLGEALSRIFYLDDVIIEHLHPIAGKAAWDAGYQEVNAAEVYDADKARLEEFITNGDFGTLINELGGVP